ncbi:hypothetical protein I302_102209 [Kwoniella bestiolae CBS 10118]|uniref:Uncharacterized protein n=1 Tax=Kwoniella bestiolae CBS 10118 TaxID=1296100 RepID=A0A1B9GEE2_9TREE|nr:hypothetical protein I302_00898 [Kwoniella bestiolae CBS 10118]OCF29394.1 hypothetical protein I302_00898 [Kwoniella bestiolae CBS 10118]
MLKIKFSYLLWLCSLSSLILPVVYGATDFYFQWPTNTSSCQAVPISWSKGKAPFTLWIVPVYGQPFFYDISDSYYSNGTGSTEILLQLAAGVNYVVVMSDANGLATGGSSEVQTVQPSNDTSCLTWAGSRSESLDFTFTVSGQAVQCQRGFELSWSGGLEYGPYNFTVIAMDQSFNAYDVTLEKGVTSQSDWVLDIPAKSRFIVMMNSGRGYGRGGTSGIYSVSDSDDPSCLKADPQVTGSWPATITTGTIDPPTLPITQSASDANKHSGISGGGIAGVVIGVLAFFAIVGVVLFFLLRRRSRRNQGQSVRKLDGGDIDLANDDDHGSSRNGMVEPYREVGTFQPPEGHSFFTTSERTAGSGPEIGTGTGIATTNMATQGHHQSSSLIDENNSPSAPGVAGPLPSKSNPPTPTTSAPTPIPTAPILPYTSSQSSQSHTQNQNHRTSSDDTSHSKPSLSRQVLHGFNDRPPPQHPVGGTGGMRVTNPENPDQIPTLPPGATHSPGHGRANPPRRRQDGHGQPTFRRHADAGRFEEEIVDLPPLYSEVPRDGPGSGTGSPSPVDSHAGR